MKKEFIMPSLEMKKFSKEIVMEVSMTNAKKAENDLKGDTTINQVAVLTL